MNKHIKKMELTFENCETLSFNEDDIGIVCIENTERVVSKTASGSIWSYVEAKDLAIEIKSCGNRDFHFSDIKNNFDRILKYSDIVSIDLEYENGQKETYYVDYIPENDDIGADNKNQKAVLSNTGDLCIVISKEKGLKDFFNTDEMLDVPILKYRNELSLKVWNCLNRNGIHTLRDFTYITKKDLLNIQNVGRETAFEIRGFAERHGVPIKNAIKISNLGNALYEEGEKVIIRTDISDPIGERRTIKKGEIVKILKKYPEHSPYRSPRLFSLPEYDCITQDGEKIRCSLGEIKPIGTTPIKVSNNKDDKTIRTKTMENTKDIFVKEEPDLDSWQDIIRKDNESKCSCKDGCPCKDCQDAKDHTERDI